ncbi:hypothetical protein D9613_002489 [Agrocybe pediades]|uniref:Uncharacterized protein n=1 Tax=Agrocybe pediades TaxID=84607 RepID=A0A8H4VNW4_9AGAR|nr:hypothetical protein D9613_002489 [Agrocybe pediades]
MVLRYMDSSRMLRELGVFPLGFTSDQVPSIPQRLACIIAVPFTPVTAVYPPSGQHNLSLHLYDNLPSQRVCLDVSTLQGGRIGVYACSAGAMRHRFEARAEFARGILSSLLRGM